MCDNKKQPSSGDQSKDSERCRRDISESFEERREKITTVMDTVKPPPNNRIPKNNGNTDKSG